MEEKRVFYKQIAPNTFEEIEFNELKVGDIFIIRDFPEDDTAYERGDRVYKVIEAPYNNADSIGTVDVDLIGFRKNA